MCLALQNQERVKRADKLIAVMTPEERRTPNLLLSDPTSQQRLRRIAQEAGVKISEASVSPRPLYLDSPRQSIFIPNMLDFSESNVPT